MSLTVSLRWATWLNQFTKIQFICTRIQQHHFKFKFHKFNLHTLIYTLFVGVSVNIWWYLDVMSLYNKFCMSMHDTRYNTRSIKGFWLFWLIDTNTHSILKATSTNLRKKETKKKKQNCLKKQNLRITDLICYCLE